MQVVIYSKNNCPFCERAKSLLKSKDIGYTEIKVTEASQLPKPEFRTVPQIIIDGNFIGGFQELDALLKAAKPGISVSLVTDTGIATNTSSNIELTLVKKQTTVFNKNNKGHETGNYPLFLGEELGFADNINNPYPILEELYDQQMGQIWNHAEVDLTADRQDMLNAPSEIVDLMVQNITWQTLADSVASRAIGSVLTSHVSNPALQDLYNAIILFESIHAKTYLHIIRQTFVDPNEALRRGYANMEAIKRSDILVNSFNALANNTNEADLRKLIIFCVLAMYLLESVNFMCSFACTFAIAERGYFQGISQDVILICRDEILHAKAGANIIGILEAQWPREFEELRPQMQAMVDSIEHDEGVWADYLFSGGRQLIGLNANLLKEYAKYCTIPVRKTLKLPYTEMQNPLPFMDQYIDTSKIQSAAQEIQLTAYLINAVKAVSDEEMTSCLSDLREQYL